MIFLENIWLVPLLPAFGAVLMFFFGRKLRKQTVSIVCVGTIALAFVISCGAVWQYVHNYAGGQPFEKVVYTWLGSDTGHLTYTTKSGVKLLDDVSGYILPGMLVGLLGAPDSG